MAKRLIDADALPVHKAHCVDEAGWGANFYVVDKSDIDNAPTVDAVEVVRCRDCKYYSSYEGEEHKGDCTELVGLESCIYADDFCSYGERRTDE